MASQDQNNEVLDLLQNISTSVKEQGERLDVLENQQKQEVSAVPTDSTAQEIGEIAKFVHQSPIIAIFIILLLFILALIALLGVGIPYAKKFFNNNFNHFGSDKNGNKITHSQMQQRQLEYERRNYRILVELGERAGLKFSKEAKDDVLF